MQFYVLKEDFEKYSLCLGACQKKITNHPKPIIKKNQQNIGGR